MPTCSGGAFPRLPAALASLSPALRGLGHVGSWLPADAGGQASTRLPVAPRSVFARRAACGTGVAVPPPPPATTREERLPAVTNPAESGRRLRCSQSPREIVPRASPQLRGMGTRASLLGPPQPPRVGSAPQGLWPAWVGWKLMSRRIYGPIWKSTFGHYENINIGSPVVLEQLLRQEGKYPMRSDMALWKEHRDTRHLPYGPFTEEGERWYRLRQVLNKRLLKPSEAVLYADAIGEVVSDLMVRLRDERSRSPSGVLSPTGISYILFETRIGCLKQQVPAETQRFIDSINLMFKNSIFATVLPRWSRKVLPFWDRYLDSWDTIFAFGDRDCLELHWCHAWHCLGTSPTSLTPLGTPLPQTSNTLSWALYHLSRDLGIQETLYQELKAVVPANRFPGAEDIPKMPMLRAVIKETLRVYPVVPTNARVFYEKDIVIGDYLFPKNVSGHHAVGTPTVLSGTYFPEPERFLPQRWLRGHGSPHHPFSSIPFGYGVRACVGRRIAELEMHLALARVSKPTPAPTSCPAWARELPAPLWGR
uniref:Cytochrome P450 family 27 subfamily A member 1 n=1 Tax=Strix occidentalis caurina TaxID=311401 RepID=A0A8D0EI41_STROC